MVRCLSSACLYAPFWHIATIEMRCPSPVLSNYGDDDDAWLIDKPFPLLPRRVTETLILVSLLALDYARQMCAMQTAQELDGEDSPSRQR
jgi:hypothetical protein